MIFRQYYLACLSHASYLVGDARTRRAVVVDPQRDVGGYLADAEAEGLHIEHVALTHVHADFVSGHLELTARTGADVCVGPGAGPQFPVHHLAGGDVLHLGGVSLEVLATPGHTPESVCLVLRRAGEDVPWGVLTGDTLLVGDVGHPGPFQMVAPLYHSLHDGLLRLPDTTRVYPAHGRPCSGAAAAPVAPCSTMGAERATNPALAGMTEEMFGAWLAEHQGRVTVPHQAGWDVHRNLEWHALLDEHVWPPPLDLPGVLDLQAGGAAVVDVRSPQAFAGGHLRGAINAGLDGPLAASAAQVLAPDVDLVLVCPPGRERETRVRLARVGLDRVAGSLAEPPGAWAGRPDVAIRGSRLTAGQLAAALDGRDPAGAARDRAPVVVDVREPWERADQGSIPGAVPIPLTELAESLGQLDRQRPLVAYCTDGYRSSVAASFLAARGFAEVSDLVGGYGAWMHAALPH